jgi:hypothetical protein
LLDEVDDEVAILVVQQCVDERDDDVVEHNDEIIHLGYDDIDEPKLLDELLIVEDVMLTEASDNEVIKHLEMVDIMEVDDDDDGIDDDHEALYQHEVDEVVDIYILQLHVHMLLVDMFIVLTII